MGRRVTRNAPQGTNLRAELSELARESLGAITELYEALIDLCFAYGLSSIDDVPDNIKRGAEAAREVAYRYQSHRYHSLRQYFEEWEL